MLKISYSLPESARSGRGTITDQDERQRSQDRHSRMTLGPLLSLAVIGTGSSLVIFLKTQGARQMIEELHICFVDTNLFENTLLLECRPQSALEICEQHKTHSLVPSSTVVVW